MHTRNLTACLIAALCITVVGVAGCSKKAIQATTEDESMQAGQANGAPGAGGAGTGRGQPGMSEQDLAGGGFGRSGGSGGVGSGQFGETDLGPGGSGGRGSFGGDFGGPGGFDPSMGPEGEGGGLGSFPDMGGGGAPGFSDRGMGSFGTLQPGELPPEDRVDEGTMIAKVEPSDAFESQIEAMHEDRLGGAAGELDDVFFGYDSWSISEQAKTSLGESAEWMKANPSAAVTVEGHCDERGSSSYNLVLGEKRAKAVRNYLVELGVSPMRVKVVSYGEERPFCTETTESCYQLNRRGHLLVH